MAVYKPSYTSIKEFNESLIDNGHKGHSEHTVCGWVRNTRFLPKVAFVTVFDGSSPKTLQCICENPEHIAQLKSLTTGAAVSFRGTLAKPPGTSTEQFEFRIQDIKHMGLIADPVSYLLSAKTLTLETLRENQHIRAKTRSFNAFFRIRAGLSKATHDFFHSKGFHHLNPNIVTTSDCEGAGEVFSITNLFKHPPVNYLVNKDHLGSAAIDFTKDFFEKQAFLTVSSQLQLELLCSGLGKVWTSNKSFRAEHSKSNRHLAEFEHIEWEFAWVDLDDLMNFSEEYTRYCFNYIINEFSDDICELDKFVSRGLIAKLKSFVSRPYARITYDEAVSMITEHSETIKSKYGLVALPVWGDDLGSQCEKFIADVLIGSPVFVYNYPKELKSFYMKQNADGRTVQACDLLIPGLGELIGSSVREESYDRLLEVMETRRMDKSKLDWYLDIRKNGSFPHAGAGLGFDRLVSVCCLMEGNIRDVVPFPVSYQECKF
jgi:asparaginyl-tRNA synthetase